MKGERRSFEKFIFHSKRKQRNKKEFQKTEASSKSCLIILIGSIDKESKSEDTQEEDQEVQLETRKYTNDNGGDVFLFFFLQKSFIQYKNAWLRKWYYRVKK